MAVDPERVQAVFLAAIEASDQPLRQAIHEKECAGDTELRARVEIRLCAHDETGSFLDRPLHAPLLDSVNATRDSPGTQCTDTAICPVAVPGDTISGRYRLLELMGEGGMGSVWMAEQREPVKRLVALKLIKAGMASRLVLARFEAERQALALMDHSNDGPLQ